MGNVDNDGTKTNLFDPPLIAHFLRVIPLVCRKACTLRMELVGCELNGKTGTGTSASSPVHFLSPLHRLHRPGCSEPLGMKSRLVSNRQITGSPAFRTWGLEAFTWHPHFARLDKRGKTNAWTAATSDRSQWLQVPTPRPAPFRLLFQSVTLSSGFGSAGGPGVSKEDLGDHHAGGQRLRVCPVCLCF